MAGPRDILKTNRSRLSALKEILELSKVIAGAVPLISAQLQALFGMAELIVNKVEVRETFL